MDLFIKELAPKQKIPIRIKIMKLRLFLKRIIESVMKRLANEMLIKKDTGKKYPTYFRLKRKTSKDIIKDCPMNWRFRIQYETDAENDYFERDDDPGKFTLLANGIDVTDYTLSLWNGIANLTVALPKRIKPDYILQYTSLIQDATKWQPFEDVFKVRVIDKKPHNKSGETPPPPPPPGPRDNGKHEPSYLNIPQVTDVHRDNWEAHGFDEYDALEIVPTGGGKYDFFVNVDNICLLTELKYANPAIDVELLTAQFRYGIVLIGLSLIRELSGVDNHNSDEESIPDKVKFLTRAVSSILIPMISTLSQLEFEEAEADMVAI